MKLNLKAWISKVTSWIQVKEECDLDTFVDVKSYTSSNMYTCPCDGYILVYSGSNTAYAAITGSTGTNVIAAGVASGRDSVYVRKGMKVYTVGSPSAVRFYPFK